MTSSASDFLVFTGNANPRLAEEVVQCLGTTLGEIQVGRFSDGDPGGRSRSRG